MTGKWCKRKCVQHLFCSVKVSFLEICQFLQKYFFIFFFPPDSGFYSEAPEDFLPDDMCATTEWTGWSECSTTCGKGYELRTRRFLNRMGRKKCPHVDTTQRQNCAGAVATTCPESPNINVLASPDCAVTSWSQWSPCSVSCGNSNFSRTS